MTLPSSTDIGPETARPGSVKRSVRRGQRIKIEVPEEDALRVLEFYRSKKIESEEDAAYCAEVVAHIELALKEAQEPNDKLTDGGKKLCGGREEAITL